MTQALTAGGRFRRALREEQPLQIIGTVNAYAAMMAKQVGYRAIYVSGAGVANYSYGLPDLGMTSLDDVLIDVRRITSQVDTPVLVDIDTGWGGAFNIARTIKQMIAAGAASVHLEDQVSQKRCGHRPGKEIVSKDEMVDRVKAAADAKTDPDFVLMARTDALQVEGLQGVIDRACAFVEAGADAIFAEAMTDITMYRKVCDAVKVPVLANYIFAALAGMTWYFQFFFYTMGSTQMGEFHFASWTLHMASIIIFSTMWGWVLHEWKGSSKKAHTLIGAGIATLILSTIIIGFGTWLKGYLAADR